MKRLIAGFIVVGATLLAAGCGPEAAKVAGGLLERPAAQLAARESAVALRPSFAKMTARSALLSGAGTQRITVRSETAAAVALEDSPMMRQAALRSDERITVIATRTTRDTGAQARVRACAKAGAISVARAYAGSYVKGDQSPDVDTTIAGTVSSCLQRAFPNEAGAVRYVSQAVTNSMLASSQEAGDAQATAQDYTDWLVYCASLYETAQPTGNLATPGAAPSATDLSVDNLIVVLYHAHRGRLAVSAGDWTTAIANRISVLGELARLRVTGELEGARQMLIRAMHASLAADRYHAACRDCAAPYDTAATDSKRAFVRLFNPYLQARYGATVDETEL
jgi:hypothetical protein